MRRRPTDPDFLPLYGRVRCRVCTRHYQHGTGATRTARHLGSAGHRAAAVAAGVDPDREMCERARCGICGGVANDLRRHVRGVAHRAAAAAAGLPDEAVER